MMKTHLRCHCQQQRRAVPFTNEQFTCPIMCVNQATKQQYSSGVCPLFICPCSKTYYIEDFPKIKAELLLEMQGDTKVSPSKDEAMKWLDRANNAGSLAQNSAREALFGTTPLASINSTSKAAYL